MEEVIEKISKLQDWKGNEIKNISHIMEILNKFRAELSEQYGEIKYLYDKKLIEQADGKFSLFNSRNQIVTNEIKKISVRLKSLHENRRKTKLKKKLRQKNTKKIFTDAPVQTEIDSEVKTVEGETKPLCYSIEKQGEISYFKAESKLNEFFEIYKRFPTICSRYSFSKEIFTHFHKKVMHSFSKNSVEEIKTQINNFPNKDLMYLSILIRPKRKDHNLRISIIRNLSKRMFFNSVFCFDSTKILVGGRTNCVNLMELIEQTYKTGEMIICFKFYYFIEDAFIDVMNESSTLGLQKSENKMENYTDRIKQFKILRECIDKIIN